MKRIAIIGAGYVGSALAAALVRDGHDVLATTTSPHRLPELRATGARAEQLVLADRGRCRALVADRDTVYLTIAAKHGTRGYREVYLEGVRHLLAALPGTPVRHVIYTSSSSVYGQDAGEWVDETSPTEPAAENGRIILASERELLGGAEEAPFVATVLRVSGIVGPGRGPVNRMPQIAGAARDDGNAWVNLVHRDDIVAACVALRDRPISGVLNLTCDEPILRRTFYDNLVERLSLPPIIWTDADGPPRGKRIRNDRLKSLLSFRFAYPRITGREPM